MKKCYTCKADKDVVEFNKNKSKADGLNSICKECSRNRSKRYYIENKTKHVGVIEYRKKRIIAENKDFIAKYLQNNPCVDCGESDIVVLDFDHLDNKRNDISKMLAAGWSQKSIVDEIAKCVVRCSNCHRRKTAKDQGWYRLKYN